MKAMAAAIVSRAAGAVRMAARVPKAWRSAAPQSDDFNPGNE